MLLKPRSIKAALTPKIEIRLTRLLTRSIRVAFTPKIDISLNRPAFPLTATGPRHLLRNLQLPPQKSPIASREISTCDLTNLPLPPEKSAISVAKITTIMAVADSAIKIALIVCSTRTPRKGPSISAWIHSTLASALLANTTLTVLDLADYPLPLSPQDILIPAHQPLPLSENAYSNTAVNQWSLEVRKYNAFIFVTPQYNFSFPASVKCAIDHLFHEWLGKPAMIVSYGARGGGMGAAQLRQVLSGCRMHRWEGSVELAFGSEGIGGGVLNESVLKGWQDGEKREEVLKVWGELIGLLAGGKVEVEG